jgi:hypothetical protein
LALEPFRNVQSIQSWASLGVSQNYRHFRLRAFGEPLAWLWRGFGAPLRLGKRQWQFENNLMELCHQF